MNTIYVFLTTLPTLLFADGGSYSTTSIIIFVSLILAIVFLTIKYKKLKKENIRMQNYISLVDENVLISSTDKDGFITDASRAFCQSVGYTKAELIGKNHRLLKSKKMDQDIYEKMWETISKGQIWQGEILNRTKKGSTFWVKVVITPNIDCTGQINGYTAIREDITNQKLIEELSNVDQLTKLYNRRFMDEVFEREINRARRYKNIFSVILLDIDFFKKINDTYGHDIGDEVLITIANTLKENIRELDIIGRWGGEEFLIICPQTQAFEAKILAEKLRGAIEKTEFEKLPNQTCSFGISEFFISDVGSHPIVRRADKALYIAKERGRNRVVVSTEY